MKIYIYGHYYKDEKLPFYIGIGSAFRMHTRNSRNKRWNNYCEGVFKSRVIFECMDADVALNMETYLINLHFESGWCQGNIKAGHKYLRTEDAMFGSRNPMFGKNIYDYMSVEAAATQKLRLSEVGKGKRMGEDNYQFKGYYVSPNGTKYPTAKSAAIDYFVSIPTIRRWTRDNKNDWSFQSAENK